MALNHMDQGYIKVKLDELSVDQIEQLQQAAIANWSVGPGSNLARLCVEALVARAHGSANVNVPTPEGVGTTSRILEDILKGTVKLKDLKEAKERYDQIKEAWGALKETLGGGMPGPRTFLKRITDMAGHLLHDLEVEEQGCRLRAWCYTVMYESLVTGSPPRPRFQGRSLLASSDELNGRYWDKGKDEAEAALADGANGVRLLNNVLLLVASEGEPGRVLNEIWGESCEEAKYDKLRKAYPQLPWPEPLGI